MLQKELSELGNYPLLSVQGPVSDGVCIVEKGYLRGHRRELTDNKKFTVRIIIGDTGPETEIVLVIQFGSDYYCG